ncbi:hypothetical protein EBB07_19695 [Paenibacillaceae bacterium]|nr:hypothetical protein EBB07_19695 [Paenibacillaceae bacterium]
MKYSKSGSILLLLLAVFVLCSGCTSMANGSEVRADKGVIDLRGTEIEEWGLLELAGKWSFYSHQFIEPGDQRLETEGRFVTVPKSWNSYSKFKEFSSGSGYGTYRVLMHIPPTEEMLALKIPNISSAYRLYLDGKLLAQGGQIGKSSEEGTAGQSPQVVVFAGHGGVHELIVQVSNYDHRRGGIWKEFKLARSKEMYAYQSRETAEQMIFFGSLVMIGFYHFGLYALRRSEKFTFYFGMLCLFVALRMVVTSDAYILLWFSQLTWEMGLKIEYAAFALAALSAYLYIYYLFPKDTGKRILQVIVTANALLCCIVLVTSAGFYTKLLFVFQIYVMAVSMYIMYVLIRARIRRREGATLVLSGISVFILTILNDMSFYNEWFGVGDLIPAGLFFFIMMQSFIISSRFSNALRKVEHVSAEVQELNLYLEERIEQRTEELRHTNDVLAQANNELAKMENSRRQLLTNISHDLRTPITLIQGYLEALYDGVISEPTQQKKYVKLMLGKVEGLNRLIHDLFELSKLEAGQVSFERLDMPLAEWISLVDEQFRLDVEDRQIRFECRYIPESAKGEAGAVSSSDIVMRMDEFRMMQVMSNLIYNALAHMTEGGLLQLTFQYDPVAQQVTMGVHDTGTGIAEEDLPHIFNRFYKKDKSRNSASGGSGIGLAIVKEIVEGHGGNIRAESRLGAGSVFWTALPAEVRSIIPPA